MKKNKVLFICIGSVIALIAIIIMIKITRSGKTSEAMVSEVSSTDSTEELRDIKSEYEQMIFKNEILVKKNEILKEKVNLINKTAIEIQSDKEDLGREIKAIFEEKRLLGDKLKKLSKESMEQLETKKKEFKNQLEFIEDKYSQQIENTQSEFENLKAQSEILENKKEALENTVTQAMADVGREKLKFYYYNQGLFFEYNNRYSDAIKQYRKVLRISPDNTAAYLQLAGIYTYDIVDFERAEFYAKKYAKLKYIESLMPDNIEDIQEADVELPLPFLKEKLAEVSFAKVNLEDKFFNMKASFKKKQGQINRLKKIAQRKNVIEAQLQEMGKTFKNEALKFHYNMALTYDRSKSYKDAAKEYVEALSIFPDDADSHYNLAVLYDDHLRDKNNAVKHYKRYLELRPASSDARKVEYWIVRAEKDMETEGKLFFPKKKDY